MKPAPLTEKQLTETGLQLALNAEESLKGNTSWVKNYNVVSSHTDSLDKGQTRLTVSGTLQIGLKRHPDGAILMPKDGSFELVVKDGKDAWGLPTVILVSHKFENFVLATV